MEAENLALQRQLHEATQSRMQSIEDEQRRFREQQNAQTATLATIEANTACLPDLVERLGTLEKTDSRHKGALAVLGLLWAGLTAFVGLKR